MTSLTGNRIRNSRHRHNRGFTMVEMMAVVAILVLLLTLVTPTIQGLHVRALEQDSFATIYLIEGGLGMYHADFDAFPPSAKPSSFSGTWQGRELLVLYLTGYGPDLNTDGIPGEDLNQNGRLDDGEDRNGNGTLDQLVFDEDDGCAGFGYRIVARGRQYGPYNGTENISRTNSITGTTTGRPTFTDAFGNEVYYYRYENGQYWESHNTDGPINDGGTPGQKYARNPEEGGRYFNDRYILCTAGANGIFEAFYTNPQTDDITSFLPQ